MKNKFFKVMSEELENEKNSKKIDILKISLFLYMTVISKVVYEELEVLENNITYNFSNVFDIGIENILDNKNKEIESKGDIKRYNNSNFKNLETEKKSNYIVTFIVALIVFALGILLINIYFIER